MTQLNKTIEAGINFKNELTILRDSGEIAENKLSDFNFIVNGISGAVTELNKFTPPVKKKNLITGEFRLSGGLVDLQIDEYIKLEIFGRSWSPLIHPELSNLFADFLLRTSNVQKSDIILNTWNFNQVFDTLSFSFAFQSDLDFETPYNDIKIFTPNGGKAYTKGYHYQNKTYFRNKELTTLPDELWNYEHFGFAVPYTISQDIPDLITKIRMSAGQQGELADLRAFSQTHRGIIDPFVEELKTKQWNQIFTQWGRWYLQPNGSYLRK